MVCPHAVNSGCLNIVICPHMRSPCGYIAVCPCGICTNSKFCSRVIRRSVVPAASAVTNYIAPKANNFMATYHYHANIGDGIVRINLALCKPLVSVHC